MDRVRNFQYKMVNLLSKVCGMAGVNRSEVEQVDLRVSLTSQQSNIDAKRIS